MKKNMVVLLLIGALTSCAHSWFRNQSVVESRVQKSKKSIVGTLALNPERRLLVTNLNNGRFCAEYPTEVGLASESLTSLSGAMEDADKKGINASALFANFVRNQSLNRRSQSVQMFMAASYYMCQSYMNINANDDISAKNLNQVNLTAFIAYESQYLEAQKELHKLAFKTLMREMKDFHSSTSSIPDSIKDIKFEITRILDKLDMPKKPVKPEAPDENQGDENQGDDDQGDEDQDDEEDNEINPSQETVPDES